jgi:MFS family permease
LIRRNLTDGPVTARSDPTAGALHAAGSRGALIGLCATGLAAYCSYSICRTPLLPLFASRMGAEAPLVGLVMAASTLTGVLLKLPAGALSDLLGRRRLLCAGAGVFALMPFSYPAISTLASLVGLRFIHGSATAVFGPVASASLSDLAPPSRRGTWLSSYSTAQGAGQALGPILAGVLIAGGRFDLAFLTSGMVGMAAFALALTWRGRAQESAGRPRWPEFKRGILEVVRDRLVWITSGAQAAQFFLHGTLNAFLPLYGRDQIGLSTTALGWLFGLQTVTTLAVRPVLGMVSDRVGRRWVITTGLAICGLAVWGVSVVTTLPALAVTIACYAGGVATTTAAAGAFITDVTRRARYGAAHGAFGTIYDIGDALGPMVAGLLVAAVGYARMFQITATVALVMAVGFWLGSRKAAQAQGMGPVAPGGAGGIGKGERTCTR